jgi:hypothetical protein
MTQPLTQRHQRHSRLSLRVEQLTVDSTGRADHRPIADEPVIATQWRLEVTMSFDHGGSERRAVWPEC